MVMTLNAIRYDLARIEALIAALTGGSPFDNGDWEDLLWLRQRRAVLQALLASRRAQRGKSVVSLDIWRYGLPASPNRRSKAA